MSYFNVLKNEKKIVFVGMMELGWEIQRWASPINYFMANNPDKECVIATLPDRLDLYKGHKEFYPIQITELYSRKRPDMYRIQYLDVGEHEKIIEGIKKTHPDFYIMETPSSGYGRYVFPFEECDFNFQPRIKNKEVIDSLLTSSPTITVAPRHRTDIRTRAIETVRNWPYWNDLFEMLKDFTVFVAGTHGGYVKPKQNNCICLEDYNTKGTSTIGLTIEAMKASKVTVGQQSGNPILSLHLGTPVISWGHEKRRHAVDENPRGTLCHFFEDATYSIKPEVIYYQIMEMIK